MDRQLIKLSGPTGRLFGYDPELVVIRAATTELVNKIADLVTTPQEEIRFFRDTWPAFFSVAYYYQLLHGYEIQRQTATKAARAALIRNEERQGMAFFKLHREFWVAFKSKTAQIDVQFTRAYSRGSVMDSLATVFDHDRATLASYKAAWGLAYERYLVFLERAQTVLEGGSIRPHMQWKESKTAAVQLLKAQAEVGSIYIDGAPATAAQLRADWEERFNERLEDFDRLLYASDTTKKDPTPYFTKLSGAIVGRRNRLQK